MRACVCTSLTQFFCDGDEDPEMLILMNFLMDEFTFFVIIINGIVRNGECQAFGEI